MGSRLFGDALRVIGTDSGSGREYRCPCGWTGFSVWGGARNHSHICPQAWTTGIVPDDHSTAGDIERGRAPCPVCGREIAYRIDSYKVWGRVRIYARHKINGARCWMHRYDERTGHASGQGDDGFHSHTFETEDQ